MIYQKDRYKGRLQASSEDGSGLDAYLAGYGVDTDRYLAVGAKAIMNEGSPDSVKIICVDLEKSSSVKDYFVTILLDGVDEPLKILDLFYSMEATIIHSGYDLEDVVIHRNFPIDEDQSANRTSMDV